MKDLRNFLLERKGWRDEKGNTAAFFGNGLDGKPEEEAVWLFLDEGLRCGGMHRRILPTEAEIEKALLGCQKTELWELLRKDIIKCKERE